MLRFRISFLTSCFFLFVALNASADNHADTLQRNSLLYNGSEYIKSFNASRGTPMFPTTDGKGDVNYYGNWYRNLDLQYDIEDDVLVTRDPQGLLKLKLIKEKLDAFTLDGHLFVKLKILSSRGEFYEQLHKGKRNLMLQWEKKMELDSQELPIYVLRKTLFIIQGEKVIPILRVEDLLDLEPKMARDIKKTLRSKKLSFKKDAVNTALTVVKLLEEKG